MVPPSAIPDFVAGGVALTGTTAWFFWTRMRRLTPTVQRLVTVLAILAVGAFLWLTLVRFNYVSALFARCGGFSLPCPLWRAFPAVAAEVASVLLLLVVLTRCESE